MKKNHSGYTLMEILITVVILGVIASMSIPTFFSLVEDARRKEAIANLQVIRMGQKVYAANNGGKFWDPGGAVAEATIDTKLNVDIDEMYFGSFNITTSAGGTKFNAQVTRNVKAGGNGSTVVKINEAGTIT